MIYVTGDVHGRFGRIQRFCHKNKTTREDILIILGDAGINLFEDMRDVKLKEMLKELPITLLCLHGNHDRRPESMGDVYRLLPWRGGKVYQEEAIPNVLFAQDGSIYTLDGIKALAIGGAYSIDKQWRINNPEKPWFPDEQPSDEIKSRVEQSCERVNWSVDVVMSHTSPYEERPTEVFLPMIDQSGVDTSTEEWLSQLALRLSFSRWYYGHFHTEKTWGRFTCVFKHVLRFPTAETIYTTLDDDQVAAQQSMG